MGVRYTANSDLTIPMNIKCKGNTIFLNMKIKSKVTHRVDLVLINLLKTFSILVIINQSLKKVFIKEFNAKMKLRGPFKKIKRDIMPKKIFVRI